MLRPSDQTLRDHERYERVFIVTDPGPKPKPKPIHKGRVTVSPHAKDRS